MKKLIKVFFISFTALLLVVSISIGLFYFKPSLFTGPVETLVHKQTGYTFKIDEIDIHLSPFQIDLMGLAIFNQEWREKIPLLKSEKVKLELDIENALSRNRPYWSVEAKESEVILEQDPDGYNNWLTKTIREKPNSNEQTGWNSYLSFKHILLSNSDFTIIKNSKKEQFLISDLNIENNENNEKILITGNALYSDHTINLGGFIEVGELLNKAQEIHYQISADGLGVKLDSNGEFNLQNFVGTKSVSKIQVSNLETIESILHEKLPNIAPLDLIIDIESIDKQVLLLNAHGSVQNHPSKFSGEVDFSSFDSGALEVNVAVEGLGIDLSMVGTLNTYNPLRSNINAKLKSNNLDKLDEIFTHNLPKLTNIDVKIDLDHSSDDILKFRTDGLVNHEEIDIIGNLDLKNNDEFNTPIELTMNAFGLDATAKGVIDVKSLQSASLHIQSKANDLNKLKNLFSMDLPTITPLDASLEIEVKNDFYHVKDFTINANQNSLQGNIQYSTNENSIVAEISGETIDITTFIEFERERNLKLDDTRQTNKDDHQSLVNKTPFYKINANIHFIADIIKVKEHQFSDVNINLDTEDGFIKIHNINSIYQNITDEGSEKPATLPITVLGSINFPQEDSENTLVELDLALSDDDMKLSVIGTVSLDENKTGTLNINGSANKLESLTALFDYDMAPLAPLELNVVADISKNSANLRPIDLVINDDDLNGKGTVDWSGEKVLINGTLKSNRFDLNNFGLFSQSTDENDNTSKRNAAIFNNNTIDWEWLDKYQVNLDLELNTFVLNNRTRFKRIDAEVTLNNGILTVEPFDGNLTNGGIRGRLKITKNSTGAKINTDFVGLNITPADLGEPDKGIIDGGNTDIEVNAEMNGNSAHELAASLNGELILEIQEAKIRNDLYERFGSDIFLETLSMISPFVKQDSYTNLDCAAIRFTAKDGELVSENQIAIETAKMKVIAGGVVNLENENLEIGITPIAKKGLGINVSNLVKFVRLGGTLRNPQPEADPAGFLKSGAAIGAAISTGGLSLLVDSLFKRVTNAGTACNNIFEEEAEVPDQLEERATNNKEKRKK